MAVEDEFLFEIPDGDSDRLTTPRLLYEYICDKHDVYEWCLGTQFWQCIRSC